MMVHRTVLVVLAMVAATARAQEPATSSASAVRAGAPASEPSRSTPLVCSNYQAVLQGIGYPRAAYSAGIMSGSVTFEFTIGEDGVPQGVVAIGATSPYFVDALLPRIQAIRCNAEFRGKKVSAPFNFRIEP